MKSKIIICLSCVILCACTAGAKLDSVQNLHENENFESVSKVANGSDNLDLLIRADSEFHQNNFSDSDKLFETINKKNIDPTSGSMTAEIGKLAGGQMATKYKPYMMDLLFVSYYQIWDALADNRFSDARVIINQSYSRQQKMSAAYKKLISSRQSSDKREKLDEVLGPTNSMWNAYNDIMNPALTYLSGLYFLNNYEYENARQYLARTVGMMPNNEYAKSDLNMAQNGMAPNNTAWIFIETGYAPRLREKRIDIPWLVGNDIQIVSVATSYAEENTSYLKPPKNSELIADIDAMFMTEYKEYQINEALRTFAKAISNAALQSATSDKMNGFGGLLSAAYSVATSNAEIRTWATLPKRIYVLRIKKDKSGLIKLNTGDTIHTEYDGNDLIYIRNNDIKIVKIKN